MTTFSKAAGYGGILFAALVTATAALSGTGVHEGEGIVNKLGANASAITYWVNEPSGWHAADDGRHQVGENADDEKHTILRFSSSLLPGQSEPSRSPAAVGEPQPLLRIRVSPTDRGRAGFGRVGLSVANSPTTVALESLP